jgi:hypothetical protein
MASLPETARADEPGWQRSRAIFVRGLGLVYLFAFLSLGAQIPGLIGEHGVLPATLLVERLHALSGASALWPAPTLAWYGAGDGALEGLWIAGAVASALALAGILPGAALAAAWILYRSLASVGQAFLGFQWDSLLLEAGFLGIFFAPWTLRLGGTHATQASRAMRLLCWWLVFRLFFFSGFVKLASGDETWWGLTALRYHWWTQPLPAFPAWYVAKLPDVVSRFGVAATLIIELGLPVLIWLGRVPRLLAFSGFVSLQLLIAATGSYGFFNLLTLVLCATLVDDPLWDRIPGARPALQTRSAPRLQRGAIALVVGLILVTSIPRSLVQARLLDTLPEPLAGLLDVAGRLEVVSGYGLFARMTTTRPEIVIEGSRDGANWEPYGLPWKPGKLDRRPEFTGPHMPRLDWQLWFAALAPPERSPWLFSVLRHLLLGTRPVEALLAENPFPDAPPIAVRALLYQYRFSTAEERAQTGAWWTRELVGEFIAPMRLTTNGGEIRP